MQTSALRYFAAAANLRSFRKAAADLSVSQPALSQQIKRLEGELGVELFHRGKGGTRLTPAGSHLLAYARRVTEAEDALKQEAGSLVEAMVGHLRIGVVPLASRLLMGSVASQFRTNFPGVSLLVVEKASHEIEDEVQRGIVDIGIIGRIRGFQPTPSLNHQTLHLEKMVVCVKRGHPFCELDLVSPEMLAGEPLIMYGKNLIIHDAIQRFLKTSPRDIVYYTNSTETALRMVNAGVGTAVVPSMVARQFTSLDIEARPLDSGLTIELEAIWRKLAGQSPIIENVIDFIKAAPFDSVY